MALFKLSNTYKNPAAGANPQRGFPAPGAGAQTTGDPSMHRSDPVLQEPQRPTKGFRSFFRPASATAGQQGFPAPDGPGQERPPGSMPNVPPIFGGTEFHWTPPYDRGAAAFVPITGNLLYNPIGAGIPALYRPQASYGGAAQYDNGALWWTSQVIPTSMNLQGLNTPEEMAAFLDQLQIQAVVRTTG